MRLRSQRVLSPSADNGEASVDLLHQQRQRADIAEQRMAHLQVALNTSQGMGAAVGLVMAQYFLNQDDAFALLVRPSQHSNTTLCDVARQLLIFTTTGSLEQRR